MTRLRKLVALFLVPADNPELVQSQLAALCKQLPLLYLLLTVNAALLAITHMGSAPPVLTIYLPVSLSLLCLVRAAHWVRQASEPASHEEAVRLLRLTIRLTPVMGVGFAAWACSLYPYGDAYARCHVAFYMAITVISCIFCLIHLRGAALLLTIAVVVPFSLFFGFSQNPAIQAMVINLILVTFGMIYMLQRNYADFADLVNSRRELFERQAETQRLSDENFQIANIDSLTQLPNRRRFLAELDLQLAAASQQGARLAVALIDLDGFKGVNDMHGHAAGDRLLTEVGDRLRAIAGPAISVARLGGDEFGVILKGNPSPATVAAFGHDLCARLRGPYLRPEIDAEVCGSAGLAAYPDDGETASALFERADYALYSAKETRSGEAVIFSPTHEAVIRRSSQIDQAMRHADLAGEFWMAYQPFVEVGSHRVLGFEALARWACPGQGQLGPDVFIPVAERLRRIGPLTEALLARALREAAVLPAPLRIAFNLSARDLAAPETMAAIRGIIATSSVAPSRIDLEINETAMLRDFGQVEETLGLLRQMGVRITLDDFGTGFSSLSHVHRLKPDKIKIDRSFVAEIHASHAARDIVRTVVDLCSTLRLDCVVEGVETEAQSRVLTALGCRVMQGYLFGRPMHAAAMARYLADSKAPEPRAAAI
jgi:diguanylate cyclase (GGDEF)-like protein